MVRNKNQYMLITTLLLASISGDKAAYSKFLVTITPMLHHIVRVKIKGAEIDDVVQEILISIHKARHTYDGERPIMPWIAAIASFRISDYLRKHYSQMRHQTFNITDLENVLSDVTEDGADNESIDELLKNVTEKDKKILTLMHVEGYTAKEVGAQLDMKESAVKVAAHRAVKKIREKFIT